LRRVSRPAIHLPARLSRASRADGEPPLPLPVALGVAAGALGVGEAAGGVGVGAVLGVDAATVGVGWVDPDPCPWCRRRPAPWLVPR